MRVANQIDRFGFVGSLTCAIHCVVCAFIPGLFSLIGFESLLQSQTEWFFTIVTCVVASIAFCIGFPHHRQKRLAAIFLVGILALLTSRVVEEGHHGYEESTVAAHHSDGNDRLRAVVKHHEVEGSLIDLHLAGALVGILGGIMIASAHILSLKAQRCCDGKVVCQSSAT